MNFSQLNLSPKILEAIKACGYTKPTPIQEQAIPNALAGKDIVASAQTGTGKTASYVLPALQRLADKPSPGAGKARILVLAPTRELANQITNVISKYSKFMQVKTVSLVGGMPYMEQKRKLSRAVDIIIATPGRLMDYMDNHRLDLTGVEMLVLDEADRMLDMGFINDVKKIIAVTPKHRQTLLFSATADDKLMSILQHLLKHPVRINIPSDESAPLLIKQELYLANDAQHKMQLLKHFIDNCSMYKAIIFSATKRNAKKLTLELEKQGHSVAALHGDLKQNVRNRTLAELRRGEIQFLIATDVAARGIDVSDITHIINYDLPKFAEDYVHRIGRTGRAGKTGIAISFALPTDKKYLQILEKYLGTQIDKSIISGLEPNENLHAGHHKPQNSGGKNRRKKPFGKSFGGKTKSNFSKSKGSKNPVAKHDHKGGHKKTTSNYSKKK